jgi:outer membrane protein
MKTNISLVLNAILLLAVIYLFTRIGSTGKAVQAVEGQVSEQAVPPIVYVNADTLLDNYEYFSAQREVLGKREAEASERLAQRGRALESQFRGVQEKVQQGLLTPNQIAEEEQRLGRQQQAIMEEREKISQELMQETQRINEELQKKLDEILDQLRTERGYKIILQAGQGSGVLNADDALDITAEVLAILNQGGGDKDKKGEKKE